MEALETMKMFPYREVVKILKQHGYEYVQMVLTKFTGIVRRENLARLNVRQRTSRLGRLRIFRGSRGSSFLDPRMLRGRVATGDQKGEDDHESKLCISGDCGVGARGSGL